MFTGQLPGGLLLNTNSGVIAGTPGALVAGIHAFTIRATDTITLCMVTNSYTIVVDSDVPKVALKSLNQLSV